MKAENKLLWIVRVSWPLLGGACGAVTGFGDYYRIAYNADSFGSMLGYGFFIFFAAIGLLAGIICGLLVGGLTEKLLRYLGVRAVGAVCLATVLNALVIWQLIGIVQTIYPGLRRHPVTTSNVATQPKGPSSKIEPAKDSCSQPPPPENSKERISWDAECR